MDKQVIRQLNAVIYNRIYLAYNILLTADWTLGREMWTHRLFKSTGSVVPD